MVENELQFVNWAEFQEMVPSILQLELSRLNRVLEDLEDRPELRDALKDARDELQAFVACLPQANKKTFPETCAPHLQAALLTISIQAGEHSGDPGDTLRYIADRLNHVHDRMELIY